MLSVAEALAAVLSHAHPLAAHPVPLLDSLGSILAEDVTSDVDSPPHDKSIVDGYAVLLDDFHEHAAELQVVAQIVAGDPPPGPLTRGTTVRIMTGAVIPSNAEAIVMVERSALLAEDAALPRVRLVDKRLTAGQNITRRAAAMRRGALVLSAGARIRPSEVALLAEVGCAEPRIVRAPQVAVVSTGNELVSCEQTPGPGKIRNSNEPMLRACVAELGLPAVGLGVARDERDELAAKIRQGLEHDVLILSGGVSAGVLDLVPGVLQELGVREVFHKVQLKPGKPLWFGVQSRLGQSDRLVFGLPGNPVSSYVCFRLFVVPALRRLAGWPSPEPVVRRAVLQKPYAHRGDRPTYYPAKVMEGAEGTTIQTVEWHGSGDLHALGKTDALAMFPAGDRVYAQGETIDYLSLAP